MKLSPDSLELVKTVESLKSVLISADVQAFFSNSEVSKNKFSFFLSEIGFEVQSVTLFLGSGLMLKCDASSFSGLNKFNVSGFSPKEFLERLLIPNDEIRYWNKLY